MSSRAPGHRDPSSARQKSSTTPEPSISRSPSPRRSLSVPRPTDRAPCKSLLVAPPEPRLPSAARGAVKSSTRCIESSPNRVPDCVPADSPRSDSAPPLSQSRALAPRPRAPARRALLRSEASQCRSPLRLRLGLQFPHAFFNLESLQLARRSARQDLPAKRHNRPAAWSTRSCATTPQYRTVWLLSC